jgi:hypothetical protein
MSVPSDPMTFVWHYDGVTALRRRAAVRVIGDDLLLEEDGAATRYPLADLVPGEAGSAAASFGLRGRPGWRITFDAAMPPDLAARLPQARRYGGWIDRVGLWKAAAVCAAGAAAVVAVVVHTPTLVARMVPASVERRLGELMVGDFGRKGCIDPAGRRALAALVKRVAPGEGEIEVDVVKMPMVNAVTLPGGRVVIFDGLIQAARSPDAVAGVIGHEVGHVRHRDVMETLLRQMGLSVVLGGLDGRVGGYTNALLGASYSRDAERRADETAIDLLGSAHLSPEPTAAFFDTLGKEEAKDPGLLAYVASHPASRERAARFRHSAVRGQAVTPALDATQWAALRGICRGATDTIE